MIAIRVCVFGIEHPISYLSLAALSLLLTAWGLWFRPPGWPALGALLGGIPRPSLLALALGGLCIVFPKDHPIRTGSYFALELLPLLLPLQAWMLWRSRRLHWTACLASQILALLLFAPAAFYMGMAVTGDGM